MAASLAPDVRFLQALADPVRLAIVRQLGEGANVCACDFTDCCGVSQPTISHHLRVLREAGIVTSERQGTNIVYALAPDFARRWAEIGASLRGLLAPHDPASMTASDSSARMAPVQPTPARPTILFLCVHNAGRSQMAAGFARALGGDGVEVASGGSEPADRINPMAVAAMAERGIAIDGEQPRRWADDEVRSADVVVTMGCGDACPYYPGTRYVDWELNDPAGRPIEEVRPIRDEIERRVRSLLAELGVEPVA